MRLATLGNIYTAEPFQSRTQRFEQNIHTYESLSNCSVCLPANLPDGCGCRSLCRLMSSLIFAHPPFEHATTLTVGLDLCRCRPRTCANVGVHREALTTPTQRDTQRCSKRLASSSNRTGDWGWVQLPGCSLGSCVVGLGMADAALLLCVWCVTRLVLDYSPQRTALPINML